MRGRRSRAHRRDRRDHAIPDARPAATVLGGAPGELLSPSEARLRGSKVELLRTLAPTNGVESAAL